MRKIALFASLASLFVICSCSTANAIGQQKYIDTASSQGAFALAQKGEVAVLYVDSNDWPGVIRAAGDLTADVNRVTGVTPKIVNSEKDLAKISVIIGTIGKSPVIDQLIKDGKIDVKQVKGQWESTVTAVVAKPVKGVENALVIAGSDKRGTIYGIYDLSEQIGVSPWYWWADVPVEHKDSLFVKAGTYTQGPPAVKYRGIFINDEGFALTPWVKEKFGNYNSQFYTKVFELLLRLKANYMWPAMWNNAFNEDDPNNPRLADEYGIVMGNSHQEPMLRAQKEWDRRYGKPWDYWADTNKMQDFWREGVNRNKNYESIISMGLRGANDSAMSKDKTVEQCAAMLEEIIGVQRKIIAGEVNPNLTKVPQLWCPYKEAQEYYEKGAKIPDDITILWCDDNWGNIRRLPTEQERKRSGGSGIYYHFDFHGGPRSYEWLNASPIPRVWEQLNLAYNNGATRIWIVNVGDIKPMEFPIEFFITFAWDPQKWPAEKLPEYTKQWAQREFGAKYADTIADIVTKYTKYNGRRKPELVDPATYSLINYHEADAVSADFDAISAKAEKIYNEIPAQYKDAYYQLVLYPAKACANLTDLYIAAAKNKLYAAQKRASANDMAERVKTLFKADAEMSLYYNKTMAGGKWNHIMDSAHIGWTKWDTPGKNIMPKVEEINVPAEANMGIAIEGSTSAWPGSNDEPILNFTKYGQKQRYIDVFNRGSTSFEFAAKPDADWIVLSANKGKIEKEQRLMVSIDTEKTAKLIDTNGFVKITSINGTEVKVKINLDLNIPPRNDWSSELEFKDGFVEADGYVSMEAEHYTNAVNKAPVKWQVVPDLSKTLSGVIATPVNAESQSPGGDNPRLEYKMYLFNAGKVEVKTYMSPTENFTTTAGLRYAISFDDEQPQIVNINKDDTVPDWKYPQWWNDQVTNSIKTMTTTHTIDKPGYHVLKFWMVDPGIVLQKIVVNTGGVKPSYLGPPESYRSGKPQ
jgi:hypothetical protein